MSGGNANSPLFAAFSWSCRANARISALSAVDAITNSTGNWPPPGSAGGRIGKVWMLGMAPTFACISGSIRNVERFRSSQGFIPTPQKPPFGKVIWNVKAASGKDIAASFTARVAGVSWSSVEFEGVLTTPKMTP